MSKQVKLCRTCGEGETKTTTENHLYVESGLPNVVLVGDRCSEVPQVRRVRGAPFAGG